MMMKHYLLTLICNVADDLETQDAVEYAIMQGWVILTYNLQTDTAVIERKLFTIVEQFRRVARENMDANVPLQELVTQISDFK